jgi:hypothetical protein
MWRVAGKSWPGLCCGVRGDRVIHVWHGELVLVLRLFGVCDLGRPATPGAHHKAEAAKEADGKKR